MLSAVQQAAADLNAQTAQYPDYVSAMYFLGDGDDTCGNSRNVRQFLQTNDTEHGFGDHMRTAILLGSETEKRKLSDIFGEEHTTVAPDFDELVQQTMEHFADDIEGYMTDLAGK